MVDMNDPIFNFMAEVKERLEELMPDAIVVVQPYKRIGVEIGVRWGGPKRCGARQIAELAEITKARFDVVESYVERIKRLRSNIEEPNKA